MRTTDTMNRLFKRKKGQAFPLAAVGLFIMALSVIATLNLGQAIYEKIHLQNTTDAAAYTLAAMEARSFNFVALTNRTQIVHYNAAMAVQSYLSYAGYTLFMVGTLKDLVNSVQSSLSFGCTVFPWPVSTPYCILSNVFRVIQTIAHIVVMIVGYIYEYLVHSIAPMAIEALGLFNEYILWHTQMIRLALLNAHIFSGMQEVITSFYKRRRSGENRMKFLKGNHLGNVLINAALNTLEYRATFDSSAGLNPSFFDLLMGFITGYRSFKKRRKDENKNAVKIMTAMANASRSHKAIYDRSGGGFATWAVATVWGSKMGATKLTEKDKPNPKVDKIHLKTYQPDSTKHSYVLGDYLSSDDYLESGFAFATGGLSIVVLLNNTVSKIGSGIVAANKKKERKHYGYVDNKKKPAHPLGSYNGMIAFPPLKTIAKRSRDTDIDCNWFAQHKWPGIAPYVKYNPKADHDSDYNQPSTWMFLNVKPKYLMDDTTGPTKTPWRQNFTFNHGGTDEFSFGNLSTGEAYEHGGHSAHLDTTIGGGANNHFKMGPIDLAGLNAFSRGMAYYHRPGNWKEQPNFFNPFWRAKLAPIGNKLTQLFDKLTKGMGSGIEGKAIRYFMNLIRNLINDLFFAVVTSLITH